MKNKRWVLFAAVPCALLAVWALYFSAVRYLSEDLEEAGQFGDAFGGFTALVSALSFAGVVAALWYQAKQMDELREQTKIARKALEDERERHHQSIEPKFEIRTLRSWPDKVEFAVYNHGPSVFQLELNTELDGLSIRGYFNPDKRLIAILSAELSLLECDAIPFGLSYSRSMDGLAGRHNFVLRKNSTHAERQR